MMEYGNDAIGRSETQHSSTPLLQGSNLFLLLLPLQKFQPHPFGAFKKADPAPVG